MAFGVTAIQNVTNTLGTSILFINTENSGNNREIPPSRNIGVGNCWIPWCWKRADFPNRHIEIIDTSSEKVLWYIWQERDQICASTTDYVEPPGPAIPGQSNIGTSYDLFIGPNPEALICNPYVP